MYYLESFFFNRVRDVCEHIMMSGESEIARKTEEYLWRKAFYDIIQKLKLDKKVIIFLIIRFFLKGNFISEDAWDKPGNCQEYLKLQVTVINPE